MPESIVGLTLTQKKKERANCYFNFDNVKTTARRVSRTHFCVPVLISTFAQIYIFDLFVPCFMKIKLILMKAEMKFSLSSPAHPD